MQPDDRDYQPGGGTHTLRALVVIAVLVAIGVLVLARSTTTKSPAGAAGGTHSTTTTRPRSTGTGPIPSTTTTTLVPASQVKVLVLNGAAPARPLASQWSNKLRVTYGYDTLPGDNATAAVQSSSIYVLTPGYAGEANRLAAEVGLTSMSIITNVTSSAPIPTRDKAAANLVLVVGPDLAASA